MDVNNVLFFCWTTSCLIHTDSIAGFTVMAWFLLAVLVLEPALHSDWATPDSVILWEAGDKDPAMDLDHRHVISKVMDECGCAVLKILREINSIEIEIFVLFIIILLLFMNIPFLEPWR